MHTGTQEIKSNNKVHGYNVLLMNSDPGRLFITYQTVLSICDVSHVHYNIIIII